MKTLKISPLYQYSLRQNLNTMLWVYGFSIGIPLLIGGFFLFRSTRGFIDGTSISSNGTVEFATTIALFVQMCVAIRASMRLGVQNGRSRGTVITSEIMTLATVAAIYSAFNLLTELLIYPLFNEMMLYSFSYRTTQLGPFMRVVAYFLFNFAMLMAVGAFGMFLSTMYWRLDKFWRVIVSVGIPVFILFGLPTITLRGGDVGYRFGIKTLRFLGWCMGYPSPGSLNVAGMSPWRPVIFFLVIAAVLLALVYPMMRKAVVKK